VLLAILLRAPADWLTARCGVSERWSLALVGVVILAVLVAGAVLFGQGIVAQSLQLADRIPEIIEAFKQSWARASSARGCSRSPSRAGCSPAATASSSAAGSG
jgi:predicted PurR-regulated permease PerM